MRLNRQTYIFWLFALVSQLLFIDSSAKATSETGVVKTIELTDPVFPDKPKRKYELVLQKDSQGFPKSYAMNIINEVCLDHKCKILEATLHWDATGLYERLEYPEGRPLTKREHEVFSIEDYEKLDNILKDKSSILSMFSLAYLAKTPANKPTNQDGDRDENKDVDGVSIATPNTVKQAVVKDAAWTTWVLWKYANTEIVPILRKETEAYCTPTYIEYMINSKNWQNIEFILKHLLKQSPVPANYTDKITQSLPGASMDQFELALQYLNAAIIDKNNVYKELIKILPSLEGEFAATVIERIGSDKNLDNKTLVLLINHLDKLPYYPVHLILRLVEKRGLFTNDVESKVATLLDHDNFFIARRAYRFLEKQKTSPDMQQTLKSFHVKYAQRL